MAAPALRRMSYAEYLAVEQASAEKHAFIGGELYAMSGGTPRHARLQLALGAELRAALRGRKCVPYGPDLRIYFPDLHESAYADGVVIRGRLASAPVDRDAATNPTVVCEVLSPSTEAYDRGLKFEKYRGLPSVQEYVLVSQDRAQVEVFRREDEGTWTLRIYGAGAAVELASLEVRISMEELYAGVFDTPDASAG